MNKLLLLLIACIAASCSSNQVKDAALVSSLPVIVTGYGSAYYGKAAYQNTSIALGVPDALYATEIDAAPVPNFQGCSLSDSYMYMGSKNSYHYIMHYPPLGLRSILKISTDKLEIENTFPLTSISGRWRPLKLSDVHNFFNGEDYIFNLDYLDPGNLDIDGRLLQKDPLRLHNFQLENRNYIDVEQIKIPGAKER